MYCNLQAAGCRGSLSLVSPRSLLVPNSQARDVSSRPQRIERKSSVDPVVTESKQVHSHSLFETRPVLRLHSVPDPRPVFGLVKLLLGQVQRLDLFLGDLGEVLRHVFDGKDLAAYFHVLP